MPNYPPDIGRQLFPDPSSHCTRGNEKVALFFVGGSYVFHKRIQKRFLKLFRARKIYENLGNHINTPSSFLSRQEEIKAL